MVKYKKPASLCLSINSAFIHCNNDPALPKHRPRCKSAGSCSSPPVLVGLWLPIPTTKSANGTSAWPLPSRLLEAYLNARHSLRAQSRLVSVTILPCENEADFLFSGRHEHFNESLYFCCYDDNIARCDHHSIV
jgi:hypothetical protein